MNILFTICGRAGSKGIKNKNLKDFLGYPLPLFTVSAIDLYMRGNPHVQCDIVLNTDSKDLIELFQGSLRIKVDVVDRDATLGLDNTPKVAVIRNSFEIMQVRKSIKYNMVVDLDITSPIRSVDDVSNLIQKKITSLADVVFSVTNARRNPYFNMVVRTENGYERVIKSSFNTRQEAPEIFDMNASLYAYSPSFLGSGKGIFEGKCDVIQMMDTAVLDIDHESDLEMMKVIAEHLFNHYPKLSEVRDNIKLLTKTPY
ncbi:hypothetical protein [Cohnella panacarvi]|uniref:acylneuraminate cytidylyltransferase family protein n=1 Tax=Cohnella panacarvi TaxID=400776 RepID=UPI00047D7B0C|nr:hypothetical protein [Cohnella panacarvi]